MKFLGKISLKVRHAIGTGEVVGLAVAGLVFAILFPIVMQQITSANTTNWNSAVAVVFAVLFPVLLILALVLTLTRRHYSR